MGSTGAAVEQVQFWLNTLSQFNSALPSLTVDGVYGSGTAAYYNALAKYNSIKNPHLIYVGQTIRIPPRSILMGGG